MSAPVVRRPDLDLTEVPRHWLKSDPVLTHSANALGLVFPEGERFFIRSVRHYLDRIEDPELRARVHGFFGQEAQHGHAHELAARLLQEQGFEVATYLDWYHRWAFARLEQWTPARLNLAGTVALEHLTASLAHLAFQTALLDDCHPGMRHLLQWHAAEEVEHRSVAFDVFQEVDGRYVVRIVGMILAITTLVVYWNRGMRHLLAQEGLTRVEVRRRRRALHARGIDRSFLRRALWSYLRPGFHPDQQDGSFATDFLRQLDARAAS